MKVQEKLFIPHKWEHDKLGDMQIEIVRVQETSWSERFDNQYELEYDVCVRFMVSGYTTFDDSRTFSSLVSAESYSDELLKKYNRPLWDELHPVQTLQDSEILLQAIQFLEGFCQGSDDIHTQSMIDARIALECLKIAVNRGQ